MLNILLGAWSWSHGDIMGGLLTTVLEAGGAGLFLFGDSVHGDIEISVGLVAFASGIIYGYVRGSGQYKKKNGIAWTGNPLDHITVVALPTPDGNFIGDLTFKAAF
jgi:hypothetical protein